MASLFADSDGLVLAQDVTTEVQPKVVAAMATLLIDAAEKAKNEMDLEDMNSMKIIYGNAAILSRQIFIKDKSFILAAMTPPPTTEEIDQYNEKLMQWAYDNCIRYLEILVSL
jgi:predicted regulator of Ras-like GTPase activity (Roadblock/LC7/MglB family)